MPSKIIKMGLDPETVSLNREDENWQKHLLQLRHRGKKQELQEFLKELYPSDIAFLIERLEFEEGLSLFAKLDLTTRGEVLDKVHHQTCRLYLETLSSKETASILRQQPSDCALRLLERLEKQKRHETIGFLPEAKRNSVIELLGYPENTAGAIMNKEHVAVTLNDTVQKAISALRRSQKKESIHAIFVTDEDGHYQGHIPLRKLVLSKPQSKVKRIMEEELMPIPVEKDQEEVAQFFTRYDFITVPVVNPDGILLGRITADDMLQVIQKEASEDILRMGGLAEEEPAYTPLFRSVLHRSTWLILNLMTAFLSAGVIRIFEDAIEKVVLLAALMPIVVSIGGSAGGQSMTLAVRNIALGETSRNQMRKLLWRELKIAFLNGTLVGLITALVVYLTTQSRFLGTIIFFALVGNIIFTTLAGTLIPRLLRYLQIDPTTGSVILVTACADSVGFSLFLGLAYLNL